MTEMQMLFTSTNNDLTERFKSLEEGLSRLPTRSSFGRIQCAMHVMRKLHLQACRSLHERVDPQQLDTDDVYLLLGTPFLELEIRGAPATALWRLPFLNLGSWLSLRSASCGHPELRATSTSSHDVVAVIGNSVAHFGRR